MVAFDHPELAIVDSPYRLDELAAEILRFLLNIKGVLFASVLGPSRRTFKVQRVTNLNHFVRLDVTNELHDIGKRLSGVLGVLYVRDNYDCLAQM
jgi:hypothetical protein